MTVKSTIAPAASHVWLVGGGIASLAAAVFLIRDAGVPGRNISILEELDIEGGALDGGRSPAEHGYVTRGGRMLEEEAYQTLWNLLNSIPSLENPDVTIRQEIIDFNARVKPEGHARLIDKDHKIIDATDYGLNNRDRLEMMRILATPERTLGARRINDMFSGHFLATNFWQMWRTTFAFQEWHSAIEMKRYMLRFIQEFPRLHDLSGVRRTLYNRFDSIARPIQRWLVQHGVDARFATRVVDVDFDQTNPAERRVTRLHVKGRNGYATIELGLNDVAMLTLGSITADAAFGGNDSPPELIRDRRDGGWALWDSIARKAGDFGRPNTFFGNIDENKWKSFTLTMHGDALLKRIVEFSGNKPGTGG